MGQLLDPNDGVPGALELLPARTVEKVLQPVFERFVRRRSPKDVAPAIELFIRPVITTLKFFGRQKRGAIDNVARVVQVPVPRNDSVLCGHVGEQRSTWVRRQHVESGRGDSNLDGPVYSPSEDVRVISVQTEYEAAVNHDAEAVEPADYVTVTAAEVLPLPGAFEAPVGKSLKPNEQASQTGGGGLFDQIVAQDRVDRCGSLKNAAHSSHAAEEIAREPGIPQEMIVQKVEMPPRQTGNFGQRIVHELSVVGAPSREETIRMAQPQTYDLPVVKYVASGQVPRDGQNVDARGIYVYWFVADDALSGSESGLERMWAMAHKLVTTGVLQRWAYISYFAVCPPGQEKATYERLKKLIAASAPEFQLTPKPKTQIAATQP